MSTISRAARWAAAILLLAIGNAAGLIADDAAQVLFCVLPVIALISLGRGRCLPGREQGA